VIAERLFVRQNRDDRPDALLCPSTSVCDVVVIGEIALSVAGCGFEQVVVDDEDVIVDRNWHQVIDEPPPPRATQAVSGALGSSRRSPPSPSPGIPLEGLDL
jgi:hypothetical protein